MSKLFTLLTLHYSKNKEGNIFIREIEDKEVKSERVYALRKTHHKTFLFDGKIPICGSTRLYITDCYEITLDSRHHEISEMSRWLIERSMLIGGKT